MDEVKLKSLSERVTTAKSHLLEIEAATRVLHGKRNANTSVRTDYMDLCDRIKDTRDLAIEMIEFQKLQDVFAQAKNDLR